MSTSIPINAHHWLIAAWPGMAGVAQTGAAHLIRTLGLRPAGELAPHDHFDIHAVHVKNGLIHKPRLPKNMFYTGVLPGSKTRLTVFIGEAQPAAGAYGFAHELLGRAKEMGVDRLATFASLASQVHPSDDPSVFAAGTSQDLIDAAGTHGVKTLPEAQIGGLNGVLLGAAMYRGIPGVCLLGEIPYFGAQIQNPKAAKHVLEAFGRLAGATLDTSALDDPAQRIDAVLLNMLEKMEAVEERPEAGARPEFDTGEEATDEEIRQSAESPVPTGSGASSELDLAMRDRIESLFEAARKDRSRCVALKQILDANGVFGRYENRFLDLFKRTD